MKLSNAFLPQTDGEEARTSQTIEDMLRACVINFNGIWDNYLPLIDFYYNNSYHSSISMAPFEALHGRRCRSPIWWFEVRESSLLGPKIVYDALGKVLVIRYRLKTTNID